MSQTFKPMAITWLKIDELRTKLGLEFVKSEDVLGCSYLATSPESVSFKYKIRSYEDSPTPSTEILLEPAYAKHNIVKLLELLKIKAEDLYWLHPMAGGNLRRHVVDVLHRNLSRNNPLIQIIVGPRQVGKTTAVKHLIHEWTGKTIYASADAILNDFEIWLEQQWQAALELGEGALLVLDEIQKIPNWQEHIKKLWDRKHEGLRVVLLGSTSLRHYIANSNHESLAGRFEPIDVPHWSYLETKEAFGSDLSSYVTFGGYPKAMEYADSKSEWFNYVGSSIINPIIDVDIFQSRIFKSIGNLRNAFRVFCEEANSEMTYFKILEQIQGTGNIDMVKKYLESYADTFLIQPINRIEDSGRTDTNTNPGVVVNCPAVSTFGRVNIVDSDLNDDHKLQQLVSSELSRIPHINFGYWKKNKDVGMDIFLKTNDGQVFGVFVDRKRPHTNKAKSYEAFRKTFANARVASVSRDNYESLLKGSRAFLEAVAI